MESHKDYINESTVVQINNRMNEKLGLNEYFDQIGITEKRAVEIMWQLGFSPDAVEKEDSKDIRQWLDMYFRLKGKYQDKKEVETNVTYKWEE